MVVLAALDKAEDQVSDIEGPTLHSTAVVLGRAEEGNIARFIQLVHGVLLGFPVHRTP